MEVEVGRSEERRADGQALLLQHPNEGDEEDDALPTLSCYYHRSSNTHPNKKTVVHFHGNGELVSSYVRGSAVPSIPSLHDCLCEMGVDLLLVEYRGYGSSGGEAQLTPMLDDVSAVLTTLAVPMKNVVVFGRSMGSVFTAEATARFPGIRGIIVESGMSDLYPFLLRGLSPSHLLDLHAHMVETTGREKEASLLADGRDDDDDEAKQESVREALRSACDRVLGLDRKWQAYRGNVLLLHCEDDLALPPAEANTNFERAWASWRVSTPTPSAESATHAAQEDALNEAHKDEPTKRLSTEPEARVADEATETAVIDDDDDGDQRQRMIMKRKVLFAAGGHQHIWPMNWPAYRREVERFLGHCGHELDDDFDPGRAARSTSTPRRPDDNNTTTTKKKNKPKKKKRREGERGCLLA